MANICWFKGIVKGKNINCEKLLEIFPCYDIYDQRSFGDYYESTIVFCGDCPWMICAYANNESEVKKLTDEQIELVTYEQVKEYSKYRLVDLAILFDVEIMIGYTVEGDSAGMRFIHYNRNNKIDDFMPKSLNITKKEIRQGLNIKNVKVLDTKSHKLITEKEEAKRIIKRKYSHLQYLSEELKNDPEIIELAISSWGVDCLEYAGKAVLSDKEFIVEHCKDSVFGSWLEFVSDELKADRDVVTLAVKANGGALEYADNTLKNDAKLALMAFKDGAVNPEDRCCYGDEILKDKQFAIKAIKVDGFYYYSLIDDELKNDKEIALLAINKWNENIYSVGDKLVNDKSFWIEALQKAKNKKMVKFIIEYLDDKKINDEDLMTIATNKMIELDEKRKQK